MEACHVWGENELMIYSTDRSPLDVEMENRHKVTNRFGWVSMQRSSPVFPYATTNNIIDCFYIIKINLMYHYVVLIIHLTPIWVIPVSIICGCRAAGRYRKQ